VIRPVAASILILTLAACSPAAAPSPSPAPEPALDRQADQPLEKPPTWAQADVDAEVELTIPEAVKAFPDLYRKLHDEGVATLRTFARDAARDRASMSDPGEPAPAPWGMMIGYSDPVETERLFSLQGGAWDYSGGAHGNPSNLSVFWDKAGRRVLPQTVLFRPGADLSVLDRALCDAVNAAKRARSAGEPNQQSYVPAMLDPPEGGELWSCPKAIEVPFALAPGEVPGKAGGLIFLLSPYVVGPYAEGGYHVILPLPAFRDLLSPEWSDQFAGGPPAAIIHDYRAG